MNTKKLKQAKWIWFVIPLAVTLLTLFIFMGKSLPSTALASNNPNSAVRFAVIGDFGQDNPDVIGVAALVASWNPDFVITTGDNNYPDGETATMDEHIGQHYSQFIGNYQGSYGSGSQTNRFWPSLGNHDWHSLSCSGTNCTGPYFDYFTLPNNERYYEVDLGLVHLFAIDSDKDEPDGRDSNSIQATWLQNELAASSACYNIVYFHHPPYSSGRHGSNTTMQWPFAAWGADALFGGHDHMYERLEVNGLPYFVNGAGGVTLYDFEHIDDLEPEATSVVRYNEDHGAMLVTAASTEITYQFYNKAGTLIDEYTVAQDCGDTSTSTPTPTTTNTPTAIPSPTIVTFGPSADAFVRETDPDANFGLSSRLDIDKSPDEESFVRFIVSGVTRNIQSATLRFFVNNGSSDGPGVYGTDNNWTETEITWNNRPLPTAGLIADVAAVQSGGWIEYDVTAVVDSDGFYNFVFLPDSTNGVAFASREGTASPELVLSFDPEITATPTPSPTPDLTFLTIVTSADAFVRETEPIRNFCNFTRKQKWRCLLLVRGA